MNNKVEKMVKAIGEKLIDELFELKNDYKYEADPEFGGYEAFYSISSGYEYGNAYADIECSVNWPYRGGATIEVIIYGAEGIHEKRYKKLDRLQQAVQDYLNENLNTEDLIDAIVEDLREANEDEWESHGFRDASDYYHYRYG